VQDEEAKKREAEAAEEREVAAAAVDPLASKSLAELDELEVRGGRLQRLHETLRRRRRCSALVPSL
jgi:hypothetical protein